MPKVALEAGRAEGEGGDGDDVAGAVPRHELRGEGSCEKKGR